MIKNIIETIHGELIYAKWIENKKDIKWLEEELKIQKVRAILCIINRMIQFNKDKILNNL